MTEVLGAADQAAFAELVDENVVVNSGISPLAPVTGRQAFAQGLTHLPRSRSWTSPSRTSWPSRTAWLPATAPTPTIPVTSSVSPPPAGG